MTADVAQPTSGGHGGAMTPADRLTVLLIRSSDTRVSVPRKLLADVLAALGALADVEADRARLVLELAAARAQHLADAATLVAVSDVWEGEREDLGRRLALAWRASDGAAGRLDALTRAVAHREASLASVAPERVRAYLVATGWVLRRSLMVGDVLPITLWTHPRGDRERMLPETTEGVDTAARLWDVAMACGAVEGRAPTLVLADWLDGATGVREAA